jgi:hypothetical protein
MDRPARAPGGPEDSIGWREDSMGWLQDSIGRRRRAICRDRNPLESVGKAGRREESSFGDGESAIGAGLSSEGGVGKSTDPAHRVCNETPSAAA